MMGRKDLGVETSKNGESGINALSCPFLAFLDQVLFLLLPSLGEAIFRLNTRELKKRQEMSKCGFRFA
eukprot:3425605-Amphidinium_carterae.1